jgi:hypothetical protein
MTSEPAAVSYQFSLTATFAHLQPKILTRFGLTTLQLCRCNG